MTRVLLEGVYSNGHGTVSGIWQSLSAAHAQEFPRVLRCCPGTFNVQVTHREYLPPRDEEFRAAARVLGRKDGNHISPCARVIQINGKPITCWLYRGGHGGENVLELLGEQRLTDILGVRAGDRISMVVEEVAAGTDGMPLAPGVVDR